MATSPNPFDQFNAPAVVTSQPGVTAPNPFDQFDKPAQPVTAADRVQAGESGVLRGSAYLATSLPDAVANAVNLGRAAVGAGYGLTHTDQTELPGKTPGGLYHFIDPQGNETYSKNAPPAGSKPVTQTHTNIPSALDVNAQPSPVGGWLTSQMDRSPVTTTQLNRPDDPASRYISAGASVIPGVASGSGGSIPSLIRGTTQAAPGAVAGQYVADKRPFQSDAANNAASIGAQLLVTALMPRGRGAPLPENQIKNDAVTAGQQAGYEFPPATTNPSPGNRILETVAGKAATQQHASVNNQGVTNDLMREDVGLPKAGGGAITEAEIAQAKTQAAPGYNNIRNAGTITPPPSFTADLDSALSKNAGASRLSARLGDPQLENIVEDLKGAKSFDASDAIDAIGMLRDKASSAYRAGDSNVGAAYRGVSKVIEDAIDHSLTQQGGSAADMLGSYRASRQTFAKINTLEDARNSSTGNVVAGKLVAALNKDAPLTGNQRLVAQAAGQAPRAFAEPTNSAGVSHLGLWGSLGAAALAAHEYLPEHWGVAGAAGAAAVPAARYLARSLALGRPGQSNALPRVSVPLSPGAVVGAYTGLPRQASATP